MEDPCRYRAEREGKGGGGLPQRVLSKRKSRRDGVDVEEVKKRLSDGEVGEVKVP